MDGSLPAQDLFFVEWFSGVEAPTKAFNKGGFAAAGYDIGKDPIKMNILSKDGFLEAIRLGRRLRPHEGLQHFATVCSTWALALDILNVLPIGWLELLCMHEHSDTGIKAQERLRHGRTVWST